MVSWKGLGSVYNLQPRQPGVKIAWKPSGTGNKDRVGSNKPHITHHSNSN
jgi:hypothetical protein